MIEAAGTSKQIKRKDLTLADKILVHDELKNKTSQSAVAKKFGILQSQVSQIFAAKENNERRFRSIVKLGHLLARAVFNRF